MQASLTKEQKRKRVERALKNNLKKRKIFLTKTKNKNKK